MDSEAATGVHHQAHKGAAAGLSHFVLSHKIYALAALIYLVIALINFWPVTAHIVGTVAGAGGDVYQSLWGIWFVGYSLLALHQGIWHTMLLFWPLGANLAYQTFLPVASLLATPFTAVSLAFGYNIIFFAGFCLSGLTMFILARYATKNSYAAFVAGLIFAFSTFHITQAYGHLDYANIEWIPLALYFFLRVVREDAKRNILALGLSVSVILACFTGDVQAGIVLIFLLMVVTVLYLLKGETRKRILSRGFFTAMAVFVVATFILGAWAWIPIMGAVLHGGGSSLNSISDVPHNALWSDDLLSFFVPGPYNGLLGGLAANYAYIYHGDPSETASYITYTVIALALLGLWKHFRENRLWIAVGAVFFLLALGPVLLAGTTLPSTIASGTAIGGIPMPYQVYRLIPFLNSAREPGRFDLEFTIALAIMVAYGVKTLTEYRGIHHASPFNARALGIVAVIAVLFFVESNGMPLSGTMAGDLTTTLSVPMAYTQLGQLQGNFSMLSLPIIPNQASPFPQLYPGRAMYYQTVSHKPILGGYTTRENTTQQLSLYQLPLAVQATTLVDYGQMVYQSPVAENYTNQTLLTLYNYDTAFVAIDRAAYNQSEFVALANYAYWMFGSPIYNDNATTVFSTENAISRSVFRSYVAYPVLTEWNQSVSFVNGSYLQEWSPAGGGAVSVFAPYLNMSGLYNTLYHGQAYYINSTMTIVAASAMPQKLYIGVPRGAGNYSVVGYDNLTTQFRKYTLNVTMVSGPVGNTYLFVGQNPSYPVRILNISFSRAG
jgi:hypothetical protein